MKTIEEIMAVLDKLPQDTKYPGMTYEAGIEEVLLWIIEEIPDEEFSYAP
jgi:hypothetical protein